MLEQGLSNVLVIVTRYFGGILLGTGGLVRAYSDVTLKALEKTEFIEKVLGYKIKLCIQYESLEKLKHYAGKNNFKITNIEYLENVEVIVEIKKDEIEKITNINNEKIFKILKYDILEEKNIDF